jgi:hypothetical protein
MHACLLDVEHYIYITVSIYLYNATTVYAGLRNVLGQFLVLRRVCIMLALEMY